MVEDSSYSGMGLAGRKCLWRFPQPLAVLLWHKTPRICRNGQAKIGHDCHLPDFLGLNYSLAASMTAGDRSIADRSLRFNMDDWPNAQTIRSTMTDWHAAFMKLHAFV
jgi:hypothetical protein